MHSSVFIHVAGHRHELERGLKQGSDIYRASGISPERHYLLLELPGDRDIPLSTTDYIVVGGRERFSVAEGPYPQDDNPHLRVPLTPVFNDGPLPTGSALERAKLSSADLSRLDPEFEAGDGVFLDLGDLPDVQLLDDWRLLVQSDDQFYTSPCGNVGFGDRLAQDLAQARQRFGQVDVTPEAGRTLVVVRDQSLPGHWNRDTTDILIQVPQGYPLSALDMFWVQPGLRLADGRMPHCGEVLESYLGTTWQRFSWHYPPGVKWNPTRDGILSHLRFARARLSQNA